MWCHPHCDWDTAHSITHKKCCLTPKCPLGAVTVERLVNWKRREFSSLDLLDAQDSNRPNTEDVGQNSESVRIDPSPYHNLRALKVPTLRASLGITGPPLTRFPLPPAIWAPVEWTIRLAQCKVHLRVLHSGWTRSLHERTLQMFDSTLGVLATR